MNTTDYYILAIESSCDDTGAAVLLNDKMLANIVAGQEVHEQYGGVVPELASREHQRHIVPVVDAALKKAGISANQLSAVAYTKGPGLMGSLLVGISFAKSLAQSLACLTVSGGHTQLVNVRSPSDMVILGETIDDAAGEAFDKAAKMLSLPYPGGPMVDKLAQLGTPKFTFAEPRVGELDFSFSGVKTSILYFLRDQLKENPDFIKENLNDICASVQNRIVSILIKKLKRAMKKVDCHGIALAGGVAANSELRKRFLELGAETGLPAFIPPFQYCTDNAAMIGIAGYFQARET